MKVKSRKVKFASRDGLKLHGTYASASGHAKAALLLVHGITSDREEWGIFELFAKELAKEGVATFRFDWRGHGESSLGQELITLAGILSDIVAAAAKLNDLLGSDAERAKKYILGSSFGGGLAYAAAGRIGGIERAFMLAPVFDYLVDIGNCAPKWKKELKQQDSFHYNDLKLGRGILNEALYFDPLAGPAIPTTIFHGVKDKDVSIDLSRRVAAKHANVELIEVAGAGHVMNAPNDFDLEKEETWRIVRFVLGGIRERLA